MGFRTYFGVKIVCYDITRLSIDSLRVKSQCGIFANLNLKVCSCSRGDNARDNEQENGNPRHIQTRIGLKETCDV